MSGFKEMKSEDVWKLLEGHKDVLTPAIQAEQSFFGKSTCPGCGGGSLEQRVNVTKPFLPGSLLANKILVCLQCRTEFNPYTGAVTGLPTGEVDPFSSR